MVSKLFLTPLVLPFFFPCIQMLEVIRLEGHSLGQEDGFMSRDIHLLQVHCFS